MRFVLSIVVVAVLGGVASAQPGTVPVREGVSEERAFGLSLGGAVVANGLLGVGIAVYAKGGDGEGLVVGGSIAGLFAPSIGHWSTGRILTRGFWLRLAGAGFAGLAGIAAICGGFGYDPDGGGDCDRTSTNVLLAIAGVFWVGGAVDDVVSVRGRVRAHNRRVAIVPMGGGLALSGTW